MKKYYKGFNKDMTCRGFQYEEGKTYHEEKADLCNSGFHACENPLDCFGYYEPRKSVFHEVELEDICEETDGSDSKVCAKTIKIGAALDVAGICKAHFEYTKSRCTEVVGNVANDYESVSGGDRASVSGGYCASVSGGDSASVSGGYCASVSGGDCASVSGGYCASVSGGYCASVSGGDSASVSGGYSASVSGGYSASVSGGDCASVSGGDCASVSGGDRASVSGGYSASVSGGDRASVSGGRNAVMCCRNGKAKGKKGACLCVTETNDYGENISCACALVDGESIKEDTWYTCKGGKLVEVCNEG